MGRLARHEIEEHVKKEFAVARERIAVKHAEKRRSVLAEVASKGNIGGYAPALTNVEAKHVRQQIIALARAYVATFDYFGVPCDPQADKGLEAGARQVAAGSISAVVGGLDLIEARIKRSLPNRGHFRLEIGRSMQSAINAGKLRLERQRIPFKKSALEKMGPVLQGVSQGQTHPRIVPVPAAKLRNCVGRQSDETEAERSVRRRKIVERWLRHRPNYLARDVGDQSAGGNMDKNTPRDYLRGKTKRLRTNSRTALARPLNKKGVELPS